MSHELRASGLGAKDPDFLVDHVLASVSDPSAGPSHSVPGLAMATARHGIGVRVDTIAGWRGRWPDPDLGPVPLHQHRLGPWPGLARLGYSPAMRKALASATEGALVLHAHGLWLLPNAYPAWLAARRRNAPTRVIHAPRGMLGAEALAFSSLAKRAVWHLWQRQALARADCLHATAPSELAEIRAAGMHQPVAVIPNGIAIPGQTARPGGRTILSLGRLHPKKGLDRLIRAWSQLAPRHPDWRLRIVGAPELDYDRTLTALAHSLGAERLSIEPALHGDDKTRAFAEAGLFVLPSLNENFAMTVAEALSHALPVISTKGAPWQGLETHGCGWWIDHGDEPLAASLDQALGLADETRAEMGARGRDWMMREFGWDSIAERMIAVYRWMLGAEPVPSDVQLD